MADNTRINLGTGGDLIASDEVNGVKYQQVKLSYGGDGVANPVITVSGLPITPSYRVSEGNSTETTLTAGEVFTGPAEDVSPYASIHVFMESDVYGEISMEFSINGTDWDRKKVVEIDPFIGKGSVHGLAVVAKYFRVVYTNGVTAQSFFRLQTQYHATRNNILSSSSDEIISKENDAQLVRVINDPRLDIHRGLYADKFSYHVFGGNIDTPSGERDVWEFGQLTTGNQDYNWLTTASTLRIRSGGNANDISNGSGGRTVRVTGLDSNWTNAEETILTSGVWQSLATSTSFIRVNQLTVDTVGTYTGTNIGDIVVEDTNTSSAVGFVLNGRGHSEQTMFTIGSGLTGYLAHAHGAVSVTASKASTLTLYERPNSHITTGGMGGKHVVHKWLELNGSAELDFYAQPTFTQMTDLWWTSEGSTSTVSVSYDLFEVEDDHGLLPQ
jgi:hypothetical protein